MFTDLAALANADANIKHLGRTCSAEFGLTSGDRPFHVIVRDGEVLEVLEGPFKMRSSAFQITASDAAWSEFMTPRPAPGFHDIFAMSATGNAKIEGDMTALLTHLGFYKALLQTLRREN